MFMYFYVYLIFFIYSLNIVHTSYCMYNFYVKCGTRTYRDIRLRLVLSAVQERFIYT